MPTRAAKPVYRGYVFGLKVESTVPLPVARAPHADGLPKASLRDVPREELADPWRSDTTSISDWRTPEGRLILSIELHQELGYRIAAPWHGTHRVSKDGREIWSALPAFPAWRWQRLLFAQVLPLAAALQGLSPIHASAVSLGDRALGFAAPPGAGKTSVAAYLTSRGATFVTDDVLALESSAHGICAHPGPGVARVRERELRALGPAVASDLGEIIGRSDKIQLAISPIDRAVPLGALYFLERDSRFERLAIAECHRPDPLRILSSTFVPYVDTRGFLLAHLDICSRIARSVPVFEVSIPQSKAAVEVAQEIASHIER